MDNTYDMGRKRGQEEGRKEIERLKKEKEWLIGLCASMRYTLCRGRKTEHFYKTEIIYKMQQALKDGK